jgi:hypothetical protein
LNTLDPAPPCTVAGPPPVSTPFFLPWHTAVRASQLGHCRPGATHSPPPHLPLCGTPLNWSPPPPHAVVTAFKSCQLPPPLPFSPPACFLLRRGACAMPGASPCALVQAVHWRAATAAGFGVAATTNPPLVSSTLRPPLTLMRPSLTSSFTPGCCRYPHSPPLTTGGPLVGKVRECDVASQHLQGCSLRLCRLRTDGLAPASKY